MISIKTLIDSFFDKEIYVPLLQRNYKWSENMAAQLAQDLWYSFQKNRNKQDVKPYTIGMITFHNEKNGKLQLIDGQQRIITLILLFKYLCLDSINELSVTADKLLSLKFERDEQLPENKKRSFYLANIGDLKEDDKLYTDIIRFKENYRSMIVPVTIEDIEEIVNELEKPVLLKPNGLSFSEDKMEELKKYLSKVDYLNEFNEEIKKFETEAYIYSHTLKSKLFKLMLKDRIKNILWASNLSDDEISNLLKELRYDKKVDSLSIRNLLLSNLRDLNGIYNAELILEFIKYILNNVHILLHITETEPINEFLNLNKNKTRFGISDHIKANMIMDTSLEEENINNVKREDISILFKNMSFQMYSPDNEIIWNLISSGYECEKDENRLKLMFCDRYNGNSKIGYEYIPEYERLCYYQFLLTEMRKNIIKTEQDNEMKNWNSFNGFKCLYQLKKVKFFEMFGKEYKPEILNRKLSEVMWNIILKDKNWEHINFFIESQMYNEEKDVFFNNGLPMEVVTDWAYVFKEDKVLEEFDNIIKEYNGRAE